MSEEKNIKINVLPSPTYNWLRMNDANVAVPTEVKEGGLELGSSEGYSLSYTDYAELSDIAGGMGYDMDVLMKDSVKRVQKISIPENTRVTEAIRISFRYETGVKQANVLYIDARDGSDVTLVLDFQSEQDAEGFAAVQTKIRLGKGATVRLSQIQRLSGGIRFLNDVAVKEGEEARFEQIQLSLSGAECYWGSRSDLVGKKSCLKADIGYLLGGQQRLDMNYIANHIGKKTECLITADGVLREEAFKLFRGTIDLRKGAKGAVGNELENVLLMDDGVVNQTIPVILCDEDDVEGNHGATIGRLDEGLLFYLESRGMDRDSIYEMMARARVESVIRKIPDEKTKNKLLREFRGEEELEN